MMLQVSLSLMQSVLFYMMEMYQSAYWTGGTNYPKISDVTPVTGYTGRRLLVMRR